MKRLALFLALASTALAAPSAPVEDSPAFLPAPQQLELGLGKPGFSLAEGIRVDAAMSHSPQGRALIRALQTAGLPVLPEEVKGDITIRIGNHYNPEWYEIEVTPEHITIGVACDKAFPLLAQTLAQAVVKDAEGKPALPCMSVKDEPLLPHRGFMMDTARHPQSVDEIKKVLRVMARYKLNRFHWHLTDDQGWRIEIRAYPKLTEVGSTRPSSPLVPGRPGQDDKPVSGFYTQDEIREVVAYAHAHGIIVIPEIEIPGHACAAIAAYPELGNTDAPGFKPEVATTWGVLPTVMAPKEESFRFIETVLDEVCELFPQAPYIHCGGDECPRDQWKGSAAARDFMQEKGLATPADIQHYFTHFCAGVLKKHGRRMVGWDEIQDAPELPANAIVMAWRGYMYKKVIDKALRGGHDIIACPDSHFYLNFGHKVWDPRPEYRPLGEAQDQDWRHTYAFNPVPAGLTPAQRRHIIGVQGNAWAEIMPTGSKLEYMVFPRLLAVAEVGWLPAHKRDAADFERRLMAQYPYLDSEQINFRQEDGSPRRDPLPAKD